MHNFWAKSGYYAIFSFFNEESTIPQELLVPSIDSFGNATIGYSIEVPAGPRNIIPKITLKYNSAVSSDEILGTGWSLEGLPHISLNPDGGINFDSFDSYFSSNSGKLLETSDGFHPSMEDFTLYQKIGTGNSAKWIAKDKDGLTYYFGEHTAGSNATLFDEQGRPYYWGLEKVQDQFGNGYSLSYDPSSTSTGYLYPLEIKYNSNGSKIQFFYQSNGNDSPNNYSFSSIRRSSKHLTNIQVFVPTDSGSLQSENYTLEYDTLLNGIDILEKIRRENYRDMILSYTDPDIDQIKTPVPFEGSEVYNLSYRADNLQYTDSCNMNAATCLCSASAACMSASGGYAGYACALLSYELKGTCTYGYEYSKTFFVDINGDSFPDFVRVTGDKTTGQSLTSSLFFASIEFFGDEVTTPGFSLSDRSIILPGDINGDQKIDFVVLEKDGSSIKIAKSTSSPQPNVMTVPPTLPAPFQVSQSSINAFLPSSSSKEIRHFLIDMNRDGKADLIQKHSEDQGYKVYLFGTSDFKSPTNYLPDKYGSEFQNFVDMDQDGIPDFLRIVTDSSSGQSRLKISYLKWSSGNLTERNNIEFVLNYPGSTGERYLADLNQDGKMDLVIHFKEGDQSKLVKYINRGTRFDQESVQEMNHIYFSEDLSSSANSSVFKTIDLDINNDGQLDRATYMGESFQVEIYNPGILGYSNPITVGAESPTLAELNFNATPDSIQLQSDANNNYWFHVTFDTGEIYDSLTISGDSLIQETPSEDAGTTEKKYKSWALRKTFADVDGNGVLDLVRFYGDLDGQKITNGKVYVSFGKIDSLGRIQYDPDGNYSFSANALYDVQDLNNDGRADFIGIDSPKQSMEYETTMDVPTTLKSTVPYSPSGKLSIRYINPEGAKRSGLLTGIDNGSGKSAAVTYNITSKVAGAISYTNTNSKVKSYLLSQWIPTRVSIVHTPDLTETIDYTYKDNRYFISDTGVPSDEIGLLGFQQITTKNSLTNRKIVQEYSLLESAYLAGLPTRETESIINTSNGTENIISDKRISYGYGTSAFINSQFGGSFIRPTAISIDSYLQNQNLLNKTETLDYISTGELIKSYTIISNSTDQIIDETIINNTAFDTTNWGSGLPITITKKENGLLVSKTEYVYQGRVPYQVKEDHGTGVLTTTFASYDPFGNCNLIQEQSGNELILEYENILNYHPVSITNSLGHVKKYKYDYKFGKPISEIDQNGNETVHKLDRFGRSIEVVRPGESEWSERTVYTDSGLNSGATVEVYAHDDQSGDLHIITNLDYANRTIKSKKLLNDSTYSVEDTEYNLNGSTKSTVGPYIESIGTRNRIEYSYDTEGNVQKIDQIGRASIEVEYNGLKTTYTSKTSSGDAVSTRIEEMDLKGRTIKKDFNGKTVLFTYSPTDQIATITDPDGFQTTNVYNTAGNLVQKTDPDKGTQTITYYDTDRIKSVSYANGSSLSYEYDIIGRLSKEISKTSTGSDKVVSYYYDEEGVPNSKGQLTSVFDPETETRFEYNGRGFVQKMTKRYLEEDLSLVTQFGYSSGNRVSDIVYPDGTIIHYSYTTSGAINRVQYSSADGESLNHDVVKYEGPFLDTDGAIFKKSYGNGVFTNVLIDLETLQPKRAVTGKDSSVYDSIDYAYNSLGNITGITDNKVSARNASFTFDDQDRLTQATGPYGTENYTYSPSGKLLSKNDKQYIYGSTSHKHGVTSVVSSANTIQYAYDESGNIILKDEDVYTYDANQRLSKVVTKNGDQVEFDYDYKGERIRKKNLITGQTSIHLGRLYEISTTPSQSPIHTLYVYGARDEIVAQLGKTNATLVSKNADQGNRIALANTDKFDFLKQLYQNSPDSIKLLGSHTKLLFYRNLFLVQKLQLPIRYNRTILFIFVLVALYSLSFWISIPLKTLSIKNKMAVPITIISIFSLSINQCGILTGDNSSGTPPWIAFPTNPSSDVPSVPDPGNGSVSVIPGMLFYHLDHLGSTKMVTDGLGAVLAGGEMGGASHITYRPYGEILRTDSTGPDVFKFKYTGQIEEKELNVYDFKARFYDADLSRFLQPDSLGFTNKVNGMDPYMFVDGNPTNKIDPSGHAVLDLGSNPMEWIQDMFHINLADAVNSVVAAAVLLAIQYYTHPASIATDLKKGWESFQYTSPIAKSDFGRMVTRNRTYLYIGAAIVLAAFGIYMLWGVIGTYILAAGKAIASGWSILLTGKSLFLGMGIAALYGGVVGAAIGYLQGGLHKASLKSVNWDDAEAKRRATEYGIAGAEIGIAIYGLHYTITKAATAGSAANFGFGNEFNQFIWGMGYSATGSAYIGGIYVFIADTIIIASALEFIIDSLKKDLAKLKIK